MLPRLLDFLLCPDCGGEDFRLDARERSGERVLEGVLACRGCGRGGPITKGVPRLLPEGLRENGAGLPPPFTPKGPTEGFEALRRTLANYSEDDESEPYADEANREIYRAFADYKCHPVPMDFYRGKAGLDAGCGFGKVAHRIARSTDAEIVGVDLSGRIDVAAREGLPNVHLIQADLYTLPLKPKAFDWVMSLGVLHHLPDPEGGFRRLPVFLKPGGILQVWVYKRGGENLSVKAFETVRKATASWPYAAHQAMGWAAGTGQWLSCTLPVRSLKALGRDDWARRIPFYENAGLPIASVAGNWIDNFHVPVWHSHRREEIEGWFKRAGLEGIELADYSGEWMGHALGRTPSSHA